MLYMVQYYGTLWYWYGCMEYCTRIILASYTRESEVVSIALSRGNYKVARETTQRPFILLNFHEFLMFLVE